MVEKLEREFDVTLADKGIEFTGILHFVSGTVVGVGVGLMLLFWLFNWVSENFKWWEGVWGVYQWQRS